MSKNWKVEHINDVPPMQEGMSQGWKSVRWHMGIESFGVNAVTKPNGEWLTPAGTLVSAKPAVKRGVLALKTPTTILIIGSPIGEIYKPVSWA
jgi:hypothetical protein